MERERAAASARRVDSMEDILFWRSVRDGLLVELGRRPMMGRGRAVMLLVGFGRALVARAILDVGLDSSVARGLVNDPDAKPVTLASKFTKRLATSRSNSANGR
jgi:hypothetical protein